MPLPYVKDAFFGGEVILFFEFKPNASFEINIRKTTAHSAAKLDCNLYCGRTAASVKLEASERH